MFAKKIKLKKKSKIIIRIYIIMGSCGCKDSPGTETREREFYPAEDDITVANLKHMRDELYFKRKDVTYFIDRTDTEIRIKIKNDQKNSAKFALQKKKLFDEYLKQLDSKYLIIEQMIQKVDSAIIDRTLVGVIKKTNTLLKDIKNSIDLNEMEDVIQNMQENEDKSKKFNQLFNNYLSIDEEILENEYNEYEKLIIGNPNNYQTTQKNIKNSIQINQDMNISNCGSQNNGKSNYERRLEGLL